MENHTFYLDQMRTKQPMLLRSQSMLKRCFGVLALLLLTTFVFAQSDNANSSTLEAQEELNANALLACGLSLDHLDVFCAEDETGQITVNLSTDEIGMFTLTWTAGPTAIPSSTVTVTAGQIGMNGLFQGDVSTINGLAPGVYDLVVTTPGDLTCFAQATIFITDAIDPVIVCPDDIQAFNDPGECEATVEIPMATATDSCGVVVTVDAADEITVPVNGAQTVTYTATDSNGNTATCSIEVTVIDVEPPAISCPGSITINTDDAECDAVATWEITADDNCAIESISATCLFPNGTSAPCASGEAYPLGTTIVTGTATDVNGNSSDCSFQITVGDEEDPVVNCPADIMASCDGGCGASVPFDLTATDNCGVVSQTSSHSSGDFFPIGTTTVTYTAEDAAGNSATCSFTVTVIDDKPPVLECPADVTMMTSASGGTYDCEAAVPDFIPGLNNGNGSFSDNCNATAVQSPAPGTAWGGSHNSTQDVIITVTDDAGNVTTCSVTLTLIDDEDPTVDCPDDITLSAGANCDAVATWADPPTADNCAVASVTSTHNSGDTFGEGTTTVTYTVTDVAGNTAMCSFTVTVVNDAPPVPQCNGTNVSVTLDADANCEAVHTWTNPILVDNCDNEFPTSPTCTFPNGSTGSCASGDSFPLGTTSISYTDAPGCNFTITVVDNTPPTVDPQDVTESTGDNDYYDCDVTIPNYQDETINGSPNPLYNATDNCDVTVTQDPPPGTVFDDGGVCNGPITVTVTATDSAGNSDSGTATVTLNDNVDPLITCPADITMMPDDLDCDGLEVTIPVPVYVEPTVDPATGEPMPPMHPTNAPTNGAYTDDCDCVTLSGPNTSVPLDATNTGTFPIGTTTVTYIATDAAGNTAECTFTVTILPPAAITLCNGADNASATLDADANCEATHTWPSPTVEACGSSSPIPATCAYPNGTSMPCASGSTFPLGTTTVTFAGAGAGDDPDCTFTVTVVDNTPPTVDPQDQTESTGDNGVYDCDVIIPNYQDETINGSPNPLYNATDNCDVTVTQDPAPGTVFDDGGVCNAPITVTVTATDSAGNSDSGTATVTLNDNVDPLITCPADITVTPEPGDCDGEEVTILVPVLVDPILDANGNPLPPTNPANPATGAYTDDCDCVTLSGPNTSVSLDATNTGTFPIGTTTVSYTATDAAGNTATCTFNVIVLPPASVTLCNGADNASATLDADANCEATHTWPAPTVEACGSSMPIPATCTYPNGTSMPCASGSAFPLGTTTVTFAGAGAGDDPDCTFTVTVVDNRPPELECPDDVTMTTSGSGGTYDCEAEVPDFVAGLNNGAGSYSDNCGATATQSPAPSTVWGGSHQSTQDVVITVTDDAGNSATCEVTLTLIDDEDPIINNCPDNISVGADQSCTAPVSWTPPTPDDNCTVTMTSTHEPGDVFTGGTTTVTYTATDGAGNQTTCSFTVTVGDSEPVTDCMGNQDATYSADDNCEATHSWEPPSVTTCNTTLIADATCIDADGNSYACAPGDNFPLGTTQVTFPQISSGECDFEVTVNDDTPPTFDADPAVIPTSDNGVYDCGVAVPDYLDPASPYWINLQDNCGAVATQDPAPGTIFGTCHEDTQDVVINVYDDLDGDGVADSTNPVGSTTTTVTLIDDVDPLIVCPPNVVINTMECDGAEYTAGAFNLVEETLDANGNPLPLNPYTYADDCSTAAGCLTTGFMIDNGVTLSGGDSGTGTFPPGTTTLTYTVTDGAGNTATCSYTVTVIVEEVFTINCPSTVKVPNDEGACGADVYWNPPIVVGSCTGTSGGSAPPTTCVYPDGTTGDCGIGSFFPVGVTTVTYEGAMPACSFEVRVLDTEKPITECPEDIVVSVAGAGCKAWVQWDKPAPTDNCAVISMNGTHPNTGMYFPVGTTTVIYKAVDAAGNTGTCNFTITVTDNLPPEAACPADIVVDAIGTNSGAVATWTPPNPVDNCVAAGVAVIATHEPGDFFDIGTTTVTYLFEDADGNIDECSFTITVNGAANAPAVAGRVAMEGASMNGGSMMRDDLRQNPLMPTSFGLVTPYGGNTAINSTVLTDATNSDAAVDWIFMEIRDANDPTQVLMSISALVQRDGDIMAADGSSYITLNGLTNGNYHVAIRHRNHLGIMTAMPVYLDASAPMLDFTDANFQTWGTNARVSMGGKMVMIAGDATGDGAITAADRSNIWNNRNTQSYMMQDCDMNGATTAADRNISYNNRNTIEQLPQ